MTRPRLRFLVGPERRAQVARLGLLALLAGSLANLTNAAIAGWSSRSSRVRGRFGGPALRACQVRRRTSCGARELVIPGTCGGPLVPRREPPMSARWNVVACLSSLFALVVLAGCGGSGSAAGDGEKKDAQEPAAPTSSPLVCPDGAQCFDFADKDSGWPEQNETGYFANQDPYLDGSYRIGGREAGTWNVTSPVHVTTGHDYGVQIETDAVSGEGFPATAAWGASCWTAPVDGGGFSGFGVYVQQGIATLGLWNQFTGEFKSLKNRDVSVLVKPGPEEPSDHVLPPGELLRWGHGPHRCRAQRLRGRLHRLREQRAELRLEARRRGRPAGRRQGRRCLLRRRRYHRVARPLHRA